MCLPKGEISGTVRAARSTAVRAREGGDTRTRFQGWMELRWAGIRTGPVTLARAQPLSNTKVLP